MFKTLTFLLRSYNLLIICSCFLQASLFSYILKFVVGFCLEKYWRLLHLTQNMRQTLGWQ